MVPKKQKTNNDIEKEFLVGHVTRGRSTNRAGWKDDRVRREKAKEASGASQFAAGKLSNIR